MIREHWSLTSRTGYAPQAAAERVREAAAILISMVVVGMLVIGTALLSRLWM